MKKIFSLFAAILITLAVVGCGEEYKDGTPAQTIPGGNTPLPDVPVTVDESVRQLFYTSSEGTVADVCVSGNVIYFPVASGNNSSIKAYDLTTDVLSNFETGLTNPFSVCAANGGIYYTERIGGYGQLSFSDGVSAPVAITASRQLLDPTYIRSNGSNILGVDFAVTSSFVFSLPIGATEYTVSTPSTSWSPAAFFDFSIYGGNVLAGNFSANGGLSLFDTASETGAWGTGGKFVTSPFYDSALGHFVFSSWQEEGKLMIKSLDPASNLENTIVSDNIPAAYKVVQSKVNPNKYYFTSCGTNGSQGVYSINSDGTNMVRIAQDTQTTPMLSPAMIIINQRDDLPDGYEQIIWTCGGGTFDKTTGKFTGSNGAVYTKIHNISE